jgi:hypothetical protein
MLDSVRITLTENAIVGLFCIQRYRFLTIDQFARIACLHRITFDVQFYLNHYGDLRNAFGTNYTAAVDHWLNQGLPNEGRRGSLEFDVQYYLATYPDLQAAFGNNYSAAFDHWVNTGISEGRKGAP